MFAQFFRCTLLTALPSILVLLVPATGLAFYADLDDFSVSFSDPNNDGVPNPLSASDDYNDGVFGLPSVELSGPSILPGDEAGGLLRLQRPVLATSGSLDQFISLDPGSGLGHQGPLSTSATFRLGPFDQPPVGQTPVEFYMLQALAPGGGGAPGPEQAVLFVARNTLLPGTLTAVMWDNVAKNIFAFLELGTLALGTSLRLQLDLATQGTDLVPSGCVSIDGGACVAVDSTTGLSDPTAPTYDPAAFRFAMVGTTITPEPGTALLLGLGLAALRTRWTASSSSC